MPVSAAPASSLESVRTRLVGLKMARALEVLDEIVRQLEQKQLSWLEAMDLLLAEEFSTRETRRIKMALMTARLTQLKTLESFDFSFQPSLDRNQILTLAGLGFIARNEVVHFLGPPGTGKSHLAVALGYEAIKQGKSVYLATLAEIVTSLTKAEREGAGVSPEIRDRIPQALNRQPDNERRMWKWWSSHKIARVLRGIWGISGGPPWPKIAD